MRLVFLCLPVCSCAVWAQGPAQADSKGCVESKVVSRMPGCYIMRCDHKDFSAADMPRTTADRGHQVEGEFEFTVYRCPSGKSPLELGRNTETALKNAGFKILYTDVYAGGARFSMTAQKGSQWVKLYVVSDADGWAQQINQSGRVSVYGINFDTGKSTVRPDSEPALNELVKLLQANTSWAMVVAGHTDNVGTKATNLALSRERAQSVISWLSVHGVDGARLGPAGFGDPRPIAENKDEESRQKNRRVDLVKLY